MQFEGELPQLVEVVDHLLVRLVLVTADGLLLQVLLDELLELPGEAVELKAQDVFGLVP